MWNLQVTDNAKDTKDSEDIEDGFCVRFVCVFSSSDLLHRRSKRAARRSPAASSRRHRRSKRTCQICPAEFRGQPPSLAPRGLPGGFAGGPALFRATVDEADILAYINESGRYEQEFLVLLLEANKPVRIKDVSIEELSQEWQGEKEARNREKPQGS
jgi:hypothetical protein